MPASVRCHPPGLDRPVAAEHPTSGNRAGRSRPSQTTNHAYPRSWWDNSGAESRRQDAASPSTPAPASPRGSPHRNWTPARHLRRRSDPPVTVARDRFRAVPWRGTRRRATTDGRLSASLVVGALDSGGSGWTARTRMSSVDSWRRDRPRCCAARICWVGDRDRAEDLLQTALVKTYLAWSRIRDVGAVEGYVRWTMVTTATSWWRGRRYQSASAVQVNRKSMWNVVDSPGT